MYLDVGLQVYEMYTVVDFIAEIWMRDITNDNCKQN